VSGDLAIVCPSVESDAIELGRNIFRKQVLPKRTIKYTGKGGPRQLTFDDSYFDTLIGAFNERAFDQNAFQLSNGVREHTTDPERYRGEVIAYEKTPTGLDAIFSLTDEGAALVRKNPKLGVSPTIIENLEHADGRKFPKAIQYVAGTLDPQNTQLEPWSELEGVNLANENREVIDLSTVTFEPLVEVTPPTAPEAQTGTETPPVQSPSEEELDAIAEKALARMLQEVNMSGETGTGEENQTLELTRAIAEESQQRVTALELELARSRFTNEATGFIDDGVPPALVELARPLLELPAQPVIELSRNSDGSENVLDVGELVRKLLKETGGFIKLSREQGHSYELAEGETVTEKRLGDLRAITGGA
jgi:hypothetical protein